MATITEAIDANDTEITTDLALPAPNTLLRLESEVIAFRSLATAATRPYAKRPGVWRVSRGMAGSTAASHADNTTISVLLTEHGAAAIDTGGAGASTAAEVSFDNTESGLTAEDVQAALDEVAAAPGGGVTIDDEDPGAIGAGALWFRPESSGNDPAYGVLRLRNATDDGWIVAAAGFGEVADAANPTQRVGAWVGDAEDGNFAGMTVDTGSGPTLEYNDDDISASVEVNDTRIRLNWSGQVENASIQLDDTGLNLGGKTGFFFATPIDQPAAVADATDNPTAITQLNDLLAKLRTLGIIDT